MEHTKISIIDTLYPDKTGRKMMTSGDKYEINIVLPWSKKKFESNVRIIKSVINCGIEFDENQKKKLFDIYLLISMIDKIILYEINIEIKKLFVKLTDFNWGKNYIKSIMSCESYPKYDQILNRSNSPFYSYIAPYIKLYECPSIDKEYTFRNIKTCEVMILCPEIDKASLVYGVLDLCRDVFPEEYDIDLSNYYGE